ncbi:MAG: penicillin-binding protein 2 [Kiritimatiellae bacterium]|nr:penicillin-binding protein 2 [Kiritimatiellia bacterium]
MTEALSDWLAPPRVQEVLAVLRAFFLAAVALLVFRAVFHFAPYRIGHRTRLLLFPAIFCAALCAILAAQTRWQVFGHTDRRFVRFMEAHDPRPDAAAKKLVRGEILDRAGRRLAFTDSDGSGRRVYPCGEATAHVVGFRHPAEGLTGIEGAADDILSGYRALKTAEDFRAAAIETATRGHHVGTNVTLCIDARLQLRAAAALAGRRGAAVALDPRSGDVLLLASSPSFDPNEFNRRLNSDPSLPLFNRALRGLYPSGSTFKTAIAGLMVDCNVPLQLDCPADGFRVSPKARPIRDHEFYSWQKRGLAWPGFGRIGLDVALAKSSNVYFAQGGVMCGTEAFNALSERLACNDGIVVWSNGERRVSSVAGTVPKLGRAERRELSQLSIGQGRLQLTPLHLALLVSSIANGGVAMAPRLSPEMPVRELSRPFSQRAARRVAAAMRAVVQSGTARKIEISGLDIGAKTGTAQNPHGDDHAWFVCFAGREGGEAQIAVAVVVENAGFGSAAALPVARAVLEEYFGAGAQAGAGEG